MITIQDLYEFGQRVQQSCDLEDRIGVEAQVDNGFVSAFEVSVGDFSNGFAVSLEGRWFPRLEEYYIVTEVYEESLLLGPVFTICARSPDFDRYVDTFLEAIRKHRESPMIT